MRAASHPAPPMDDPDWLPRIDRAAPRGPEELMALALEVALASARHGGGPFGALVADADGRVLAVGWNAVLALRDSTAHAEIVALRRAQQERGSHHLAGCTLYTSCAPCIQCYGAIYWSGLARVCSAARKEDAEAIGFDEGPPMDGLWAHARAAKGIEHVRDFLRGERALLPLRTYAERGGVNYSRE